MGDLGGLINVSRRSFVTGTAAGLAATALSSSGAAAESKHAATRLLTLPTRVFKIADPRRRAESWFYTVVTETSSQRLLDPKSATIDYFSAGRHLKRETMDAPALDKLAYRPSPPDSDPLVRNTLKPVPVLLPDGSAPPTPIYRPLSFPVRSREAAELNVDKVRIELVLVEKGGLREERLALDVPIETYEQKTKLILPFKGAGIVTQGGLANDGHRNRSGQFALDFIGTTDTYSVLVGPRFEKNEDLVGFGRQLIAPADGIIAHVRADRPDQPVPGNSDEAYHVDELKGGGDPGNHIVIDHGNGEYSFICHFQAGSILVKKGDRVKQGQPLGKLGNSGDSTSPHLHYQLQTGPDWQYSDALPYRLSNVSAYPLVRGVFFEAT